MKAVLDIPDDLAAELERQAKRDGRETAEQLVHLVRLGLQVTVGPPDAPICKTERVLGGKARVRNTRIPVWTLVQFKKLGRADAELLKDFPGLTPDDLDAVWDYYRDHTAEIEMEIAAEAGGD